MTSSLRRVLPGARQVVLTVGAVVGLICILVAIGAVLFGLRPLVFRSGSMGPTIDTGALALARQTDAADLRTGDIVSVENESGDRVTHRVSAIEHDGQDAILTLKGDANEYADAAPYPVSEADRVLFSVPKIGYVMGWLNGPFGLFLLGLYAAFLISVLVRGTGEPPSGGSDGPAQPPRGGRRKAAGGRRASRVVVPAVALTFVAGTVAQVWALPTLAAWTDAGGVSGATLTAYTVPQPAIATCNPNLPGLSGSTRYVTYTWPGVTSPPTTYTVSVTGITPGTIPPPTGTTTKSVSIPYSTSNPSGNRNKVATVTVTPTVAGPWAGPEEKTKFRTSNNSNAATCGEADPPTVEFVGPDATNRTVSAERTFITSACTSNTVILCGTYTDVNTVDVDYTLRRVATVGGATRCWTGSWTTSCTTFQQADTTTLSGLKVWYESGTQTTVYPNVGGAGTYTLTVRATDTWDNVTTEVLTFQLT